MTESDTATATLRRPAGTLNADQKAELLSNPEQLFTFLMRFEHDPYGMVLAIFPWGEPGTELAEETGPDTWQTDVLKMIGNASLAQAQDLLQTALQLAVASGNGPGKTALISWVIIWFISTRTHPQIIVTANTEVQLRTKTWRELAKWHALMIHRDHFDYTATQFKSKSTPKTHFATAIPWSEHNPAAFQGAHDANVLILFDESSGIARSIWDAAMGSLTTKRCMFFAFGNPNFNTGMFFECFHKFQHRWITYRVDSRTAKKANKKQIEQWIEDFGIDSDWVRVRVLGQFPQHSSMQFIGNALVEAAFKRQHAYDSYRDLPIVMGVDEAWFGDDRFTIWVRQGIKILAIEEYRELKTFNAVMKICAAEDTWGADAVFVDLTGLGVGIVERGQQLGREWMGVVSGEAANQALYFNKRAEMWGATKDWLATGDLSEACKDEHIRQAILDDLTGPDYGYNNRFNKIQLEKKDEMKARGLASPDHGDGLAFTFAYPVAPRFQQQDNYDYWERRKNRVRAGAGGRDPVAGY